MNGADATMGMRVAPATGTMQAPLRATSTHATSPFDVVCFSHLRWQFVFQRPQHLMSRCARGQRVYFLEEPVLTNVAEPSLSITVHDGVYVVIPQLPETISRDASVVAQGKLLDQLLASQRIVRYVCWYYTPLALYFSSHLRPAAVVYDCMDELSAFKGAASDLPQMERDLLRRADVVFTGGHSLYEAKQHLHHNIHAMPSSVDVPHFAAARTFAGEPEDQRPLSRPRLGFFGVIDERLDLALLAAVADARPSWQMVMIGPVVKIDPGTLPRRANVHYLGAKPYAALPAYLAGWDVALLPFARNAATRFISPTKTPEYLAAGKPVVSTSIRDVVTPYGDLQLVRIADYPTAFVRACEQAMAEPAAARLAKADTFLRTMSWDRTWSHISGLVDASLATPPAISTPSLPVRGTADPGTGEHYV